MRPLLTITLLALTVMACDRQPEKTYQGRRVSEWVRLAADKDYKTQTQALDALGNFSKDDPGVSDALRKGMGSSISEVRLTAADSWLIVTDDAAPVLPVVSAKLRETKDRGNLFYGIELLSIAEKLGPKGKSLLADIEYAKAALRKTKPADLQFAIEEDLKLLDEMAKAVRQ